MLKLELKPTEVRLFSEKVNDQLYDLVRELSNFAISEYGETLEQMEEDYFKQFSFSEEEEEYLVPYHLFWAIFFAKVGPNNKTVYEMFLLRNKKRFKSKPLLEKALNSWKSVSPSFFFIEEKIEDRVVGLYDVFEEKGKLVIVDEETYNKVEHGDLLTGTVLPYADHGYFSVIDLLFIPGPLRFSIGHMLKSYMAISKRAPKDFLSSQYPEMLRRTLKEIYGYKIIFGFPIKDVSKDRI